MEKRMIVIQKYHKKQHVGYVLKATAKWGQGVVKD
jgi:hypothetical protein